MLSKNQNKTNKLLHIIDTHGLQTIPGTSYSCVPMYIRISADGDIGTLIFCVKSSALLSQQTDVKTKHML